MYGHAEKIKLRTLFIEKCAQETTYRMGENICKWCDQQELNFQNIQTAHTTQQQENLIKKCAEELNRHLSKGHILMAKKHMKRISPLWIIRKMQMKSTMSYHFTPVRMAIIKITVAQRVWSKGNPPTLLVGISFAAGTMENGMEVPQKIKSRITL